MLLGVWDGFLNPTEEALSSMSKLGGKPVYMTPNADSIRELVSPLATCGVCGDPMFLLLQCYCPLPDGNEDYNRMKYVFCCNNATCSQQPDKSWVSINVTNSTFDEAAERGEGEEEEDDEIEEMPAAPHHLPFTFPSAGIDVIDEPEKAVVKLSDHEQHMLAQYERRQLKQKKIAEMRARGEEPDEQELLEAGLTQEDAEEMEKEIDLKNKSSDVAYDKFRRRIERCPTQVIRYQFKGQPIFMNPSRVKDVKVPACGRCGGPQTMELQIMPTVIFLLRTSEYVKGGNDSVPTAALTAAAASAEVSAEVKEAVRAAGEGVDFASVTCYHCSNPKCGSDYTSLFELSSSAENNSSSLFVSKGVVGGVDGEVRFNIRKDFLLVEGAPDLEEEMRAQEQQPSSGSAAATSGIGVGPLAPPCSQKGGAEPSTRPKTLREIMFDPIPQEYNDDTGAVVEEGAEGAVVPEE